CRAGAGISPDRDAQGRAEADLGVVSRGAPGCRPADRARGGARVSALGPLLTVSARPHPTPDVRRLAAGASSSRRNGYLPFSPPLIGEEEIAEVADTLRSDWLTTGPKVARFEAEFAAAVSAPAALALNSCTAGLHTALVANGIGPGDEV